MSKLLSILVAAVFAVSTGSVFAASHVKAAGEKKDEMKKEEKAAPAKEMKAPKKEKKAKKEKKEEKKEEMKK